MSTLAVQYKKLLLINRSWYFILLSTLIVFLHTMEKLSYDYSLKNIPTPNKISYQVKLVEKIESVLKRMRWKAHFFSSDDEAARERKETFGFKSRFYPPQSADLESFEKDVLDIIKSIEFKETTDEFQKKLKADISEIKQSPDVLVFADKTNNIYKMTPENHDKLVKENITKVYKKAPQKLESSINSEAKCIASNLDLDNRIEYLAKTPAYVTLKDHKENFPSNPSCRLLSPSKNELGKISKIILQQANTELLSKLKFMQWKNTSNVIEWFEKIEDKKSCKFVQLDIKEFYPSITEQTLDKAISFALELVTIPEDRIRIVKHCRKSLLYHTDEP